MKKINRLSILSAILTTILSLPGIAGAQLLLEEVVVTAQKRAKNVQEVAIGISALSNESLEKANIKPWKNWDMQFPVLAFRCLEFI